MKYALLIVAAALMGAAGLFAHNNIPYWGWFLVTGFLLALIVAFNENDDK